jgi:hypothetical protein
MVNSVVEIVALLELCGNFIVGRPWILWRLPLWRSKARLLIKNTSSLAAVAREGIVSIFHISILMGIRGRTRSIFYLWEALGIGINFSVFAVLIFADLVSASIILKIDWLIGCRAWGLRVRISLKQIDGLGPNGVLFMHSYVSWFVVLHYHGGTWPGPGYLCIWGIRYDLSGDFYLAQPNDLPDPFSSKVDFIW